MRRISEQRRLQINLEGIALEKAGQVEAAIAIYELGIAGHTDTPHTYRRLAVLYRRLKRPEDLRWIQEHAKEQFGHYF